MNKKIFGLVAIIFIVGLFLLTNKQEHQKLQNTPMPVPSVSQTDPPQIIFTKPSPLEEAIISAAEVIEITFNRSLENEGELKLKFEPKLEYKTDYKIELSQDRKTAKIIPLVPYELGSTYTLFIGTDTKFDGVGAWGQEKIYHFKTIRYRGV